MSYADRMRTIVDDMEQNSRMGTSIPQFHQAIHRNIVALGELLVQIATETDARLAALPPARETFSRPSVTERVRNPFGY